MMRIDLTRFWNIAAGSVLAASGVQSSAFFVR